ncbi:MAG: 1-acyl-sn-glycerol-3-phosphate acyltransferase [Bacteroidales bacterium]|nr:1-acyl-sn-glycerol-3-phosphate acyltransferase [Bacteroidales bacterium]MBR4228641.1 1-acyl-sn-glycerol-3-phosphate acyltransferase [Bacteroidales bacterium]
MTEDASMTIDLEKVVESKAGKGRVPRFLINWGKKFIHQDYINGYLSKGYTGVDFCEGTIRYLGVNIKVEGMEHLDGFPEGTRFTIVSNHPLGGIDGVTLGMVFGRRFDGKIKYLVNDILMNIKGLAPMCVPVNVIGGQSRDLPSLIDAAFNSENHIIMFPGKTCSRKIDGKIQDLPWGKAFINKSVQTGRYVVPVHFIGQNSKRFYRVANLNKKLGIKFNFAMLFLPDEMYKARNSTFTVKVGEPIAPATFGKEKSAQEWAQWVREKVYSI